MPIFRMRQLGGVGVVTDLPSFDLPQNAWTKCLNVRFFGNKVQKIGGNRKVLTSGSPDEVFLSICPRPNSEQVVYGTPTSLYLVDGITHLKASKLVEELPYKYTATPERNWFYTYMSNSVIMNTYYETPQGLIPGSETFIDIPGWGSPNMDNSVNVNWKTPIIRSYKDYLIALGMQENNVDYPQRVRWSDISFVNSLPTNWHQDNPNTDGGFVDLSNAVGKIVDGVAMMDKFIVYTDQETFIMDYVGGDFIFSFRKLFNDAGLLAPECACEFEGKHFVISQDDIFIHNGSTRTPIASGRVKDYLISEISSTNPLATKVFTHPKRKEIWVQYVSNGSGDILDTVDPNSFACNKVAIWNYEFDTWTFSEISNSFDINLIKSPETDTRIWDTYDTIGEDEWDSTFQDLAQWDSIKQTFKNQTLISASRDKSLYLLDVGNTFTYKSGSTEYTRPMTSILERKSIDFDEVVEDITRYKMITKISPQMSGTGTLTFHVGGANNPEVDPILDESQQFVLGEDVKVDCFVNHRYPAIKIVDTSAGIWDLTSIDVTFLQEGTR